MPERHHTHLSLEERIAIQNGIEAGKSFSEIADGIMKDRATVSREVRRYRTRYDGASRAGRLQCAHILRGDCTASHLCASLCMRKACKGCKKGCGSSCPMYSRAICKDLERPPYVCNTCPKRGACEKDRYFYKPVQADARYRQTLSSSRNGISLNEDARLAVGGLLSNGLKRGLSFHQIISGCGEDAIGLSESTLYRYVKEGVFHDFGIGPLSLPRRMYRPRRNGMERTYKVDKQCLEGRRHEDWLGFREQNPDICEVQIDSVLGAHGSPCCLLTIYFTDSHLMLAYPRERNTAESVRQAFDMIWDAIGSEAFASLFPAILTDNGSEFSDPLGIEMDRRTGECRTRVFYCHPYSSWEKGSCEVNHEFIRRIIPKGSIMDLSKEQADMMMSHINSCPRKSLGGRTPYEAFAFFHPEEGEHILSRLGITHVSPDSLMLRPELLESLK